MKGEDVVACMPTGSGKSLIFQAIILSCWRRKMKNFVAIIVTPLRTISFTHRLSFEKVCYFLTININKFPRTYFPTKSPLHAKICDSCHHKPNRVNKTYCTIMRNARRCSKLLSFRNAAAFGLDSHGKEMPVYMSTGYQIIWEKCPRECVRPKL